MNAKQMIKELRICASAGSCEDCSRVDVEGCNKLLLDAAELLERVEWIEHPKWISAEEQLPATSPIPDADFRISGPCWAATDSGTVVAYYETPLDEKTHWNTGDSRWVRQEDCSVISGVAHWMPVLVPVPPKAE